MRVPVSSLALLPLILAGCASVPSEPTSDQRDLTETLAGRTTGAPQRCVDLSRVGGPQVIDNRTIVYRQTGRRVWVNNLAAECPSLRRDSILVVRVFGSQLCENDQFNANRPGESIPGPICRFGQFTPYDKPGK